MNITATDLVYIIPIIILSIATHEAMHAYTAHWLGDDTAERQGRITLNPLKHIDPFTTLILPVITLILFRVPLLAAKPVPFNPDRVRYDEFGAAMVGVAGPLTNFALAAVGAGILHLTGNSLNGNILEALLIFTEINVALFIFNMIPIPPLDGSRLLYAFAPESLQGIMAQLEQFGVFLIFGLVLAVPAFTDILFNLNNSLLNWLL